ncbi:putative two-component hybrid sensor and regulator [Gemmatimonas aurantiaca T-27]|uniref:histidine kinase n=2 Tax=Gemmatimonas aurantiaca TaxID=173480 RepID=C1ACK7_GEMAT|nr:ATP-binding protein [Gemmatimonas aurantiaca]BAH40234.1 putative two-component hybrid sensor and regulator [Gemmatimonas aurantiaca T-27]
MPRRSPKAHLAAVLKWIAASPTSAVDAWRRRIFSALLLGVAALGMVAYIPSTWFAWKFGDYDVVILGTAVYALAIVALLARQWSFATRAGLLASLPAGMGAYFLFSYGHATAAPVWLLTFPIFCATLIGRKAAQTAILFVTLTYAVCALAVDRGMLWWALDQPNALGMLTVTGGCSVLLATALSFAITAIFDGLAAEALARVAAEEASVQFARAVNQSDGFVMLLNVDGSVANGNVATNELLARESVPWDEAPWTIVRAGEPWAGTFDWPLKDGAVMRLSGTISLVRDEQGTVTQYLATLRDVERERFLETRLEQGQRLAAIGTLAGGIAHDFNNLLHPILSNTEAARAQLDNNGEAAMYLDDIRRSAERARTLVRRILSYSRTDNAEREPLDLGELLTETDRLLRATLPQSVHLHCVSEPGVIVRAESGEIQQILLNLATNAAHAMPTGGTLRISATGAPVRDDAVLTSTFRGQRFVACLQVQDTGIGMDDDTITRAFEPFFTTKSLGRGTGLGLAMVHTTVTALGGVIVPMSRVGAGTTMMIYLPLAAAAPPEPTRADKQARTPGVDRILVVDDEAMVLMATRRQLERLGWQVTALTDPAEAASLLADNTTQFDCLMTDLAMPGMSGVQLAGVAEQLHPELPVVLTTGYLDHELQPGERYRIVAVLPKPFTSVELNEVLLQAMQAQR